MTAHFVNLLDDLRRRSLRMASQVEDIVQEACEVAFASDATLAERIVARDRDVDTAEVEVEGEVIRLMALYQPVGIDLRLLCTVLKVNNDLERISDCAVNMAERAKHLEVQPVAQTCAELREMAPTVRRSLRNAVKAYADEDPECAKIVIANDEAVDKLYGRIIRNVVANASRSSHGMSAYLDLLSVAKNLERIADHATNIAEDVIYLSTGQIIRHRSKEPWYDEVPSRESETADRE